ncbi:MAG: ABC transporter permease, partial [Rhodopirellula sp. JB055]|uniref:ABC transporter permease n=1 Tax=Rhodopirellula sp. JB055 TaxID=3342846 RepID=UPI00370A29FD
AHYLRLVGGPSAWGYLIIAGLIAGFTTTYFTLRFLPFRLYTQPLLIDELLSSIGFALYRILVPVLATVLVAARCGAAVAADVGVKQYGGQVDAFRTLGIRAPAYLLVPILAAFLIATPVLEWIAFTAAHWISRITFNVTYPEMGVYFWQQHFFRAITPDTTGASGISWWKGWDWVLAKNLLCGFGTAAIGYHQGITPKHSAGDVSHCITATVLWTTLYVLVVHFIVALLEF